MAIVLGAAGTEGGAAASHTVSLTPSGSDRIMWAAGFLNSGNTLSSIVFNTSETFTQVSGSPFTADGGNMIYLAYLINPSATTADCVATYGASGNTTLHAAWYTGAHQSGVPDATNTSNIGTTTTPSQAVTTVLDNCFAVWMLRKAAGGAATAGTDTTLLTEYDSFGSHFLASTAAKTPAGSLTLNATVGSAACYGIIASFAPVQPSAVKTVDGLARASVKTVNGLAIASVKTINGLA